MLSSHLPSTGKSLQEASLRLQVVGKCPFLELVSPLSPMAMSLTLYLILHNTEKPWFTQDLAYAIQLLQSRAQQPSVPNTTVTEQLLHAKPCLTQ